MNPDILFGSAERDPENVGAGVVNAIYDFGVFGRRERAEGRGMRARDAVMGMVTGDDSAERFECFLGVAVEVAAEAAGVGAVEEFTHDFGAGRTDNISVPTETREPNWGDAVGDPEIGGVESGVDVRLLMGFYQAVEAGDDNLATLAVAQAYPTLDLVNSSSSRDEVHARAENADRGSDVGGSKMEFFHCSLTAN